MSAFQSGAVFDATAFATATAIASAVTVATTDGQRRGFSLYSTLDQPMWLVVDGVDKAIYVPAASASLPAVARVFDFSGSPLKYGATVQAYRAGSAPTAGTQLIIDAITD